MEVQEKIKLIDKNYVPQIGDIILNINHPLVTIETVYELDRRSTRVNKNYNDQLFKHNLLKKVIKKREIIWDQHKDDRILFPIRNINAASLEYQLKNYQNYCFYNDSKRYIRLYESKYRFLPNTKINTVIGKKTMVTLNHSLCSLSQEIINGRKTNKIPCRYWFGKYSVPLNYIINNKFIYISNIYNDIFFPDVNEIINMVSS